MSFTDDLASLINRYSLENKSDTPDFILAQYLVHCLDAFNEAANARESWYSPENLDERLTYDEESAKRKALRGGCAEEE